jgi:hypothetical protein
LLQHWGLLADGESQFEVAPDVAATRANLATRIRLPFDLEVAEPGLHHELRVVLEVTGSALQTIEARGAINALEGVELEWEAFWCHG